MFCLKLFGTPSLENNGTPVTGRAAQRHRLALLALLALAPGRRLSRDKLIAYLWPDRDADGARNLLKVSTYVLRGVLGDNALFSEGDDLRLNADVIEVDVNEFDAALQQHNYVRALELYQGPFLDGFFLSDTPEFGQWSDRERERLLGGWRRALETLAQTAEASGDFEKAITWWKQRAVQDPYDSRVALKLMQCFDAVGNRAGALQHASVHERLLQTEFGIGLPDEIAESVEQWRREAVTAKAPSPAIATAVPTALPLEEPVQNIELRNTHRKKWWAVAALMAAVSLSGAFLVVRPRAADPERSIVVLPFVNLSPEQDVDYFSDGLTEEVIARLAAIPETKVISRTSAMRYKGSALSLPQIARELDVALVLEGSVRHSDGNVRITAQLVAASADDHLWAENYEYKLRDSFRAQEEIALDVARALAVELSEPTRKVLAKQGTTDQKAYEFYRRGRMLWNLRTREGHQLAIEFYHRAIERDSGYAAAWAGLSDAYHTAWQLNLSRLSEDETYRTARVAALRALELDESSSDAHTSAATAELSMRNLPGAAREFRRAIELNPSNAGARTWYTLTLLAMGQIEEATRESNRATELDPFSAVAISNNGWLCYLVRNYECALREYQKSLEVNPNWLNAERGLALVFTHQGKHAEAIRILQKLTTDHPHRPDFVADLAHVQARAGQHENARAVLERAKLDPIQPFHIGRAYVSLGEVDSAFVWLERSNWHWPARGVLIDPGLDPIRNNPRFAQLTRRVEQKLRLR